MGIDDPGRPISVRSAYDVDETTTQLQAAVRAAGLIIFADIDHRRGAIEAGLDLRPTRLTLFGHPKGGTPMMQIHQTAGIDLPLKALAWEDENGVTWLSYNDPHWIATRHELGAAGEASAQAMATGMAKLIAAATA